MTATVINPEGRLETWPPEYVHELLEGEIRTAVGEELLFENSELRIWSIVLKPKSRLPFHRHTTNYNWTCMTDGKAISRYENGKIKRIIYQKGDMSYYDHDRKGNLVHDLENIGSTPLYFTTVEYKM